MNIERERGYFSFAYISTSFHAKFMPYFVVSYDGAVVVVHIVLHTEHACEKVGGNNRRQNESK